MASGLRSGQWTVACRGSAATFTRKNLVRTAEQIDRGGVRIGLINFHCRSSPLKRAGRGCVAKPLSPSRLRRRLTGCAW